MTVNRQDCSVSAPAFDFFLTKRSAFHLEPLTAAPAQTLWLLASHEIIYRKIKAPELGESRNKNSSKRMQISTLYLLYSIFNMPSMVGTLNKNIYFQMSAFQLKLQLRERTRMQNLRGRNCSSKGKRKGKDSDYNVVFLEISKEVSKPDVCSVASAFGSSPSQDSLGLCL